MTEWPEGQKTNYGLHKHNDFALLNCIERLDTLLRDEEHIIGMGWPFDLDAINNLKAHLLHEFTQLSRNSGMSSSVAVEARLKEVMKKAAQNAFLLEQHFLAIQEISRLMVENAKREDSDGTYSRRRISWRYDIES